MNDKDLNKLNELAEQLKEIVQKYHPYVTIEISSYGMKIKDTIYFKPFDLCDKTEADG